MARWNLTFLLVLFFETSSTEPFLCFRRYNTVHEILRGFLFIRNERSLFLFKKLKHQKDQFECLSANCIRTLRYCTRVKLIYTVCISEILNIEAIFKNVVKLHSWGLRYSIFCGYRGQRYPYSHGVEVFRGSTSKLQLRNSDTHSEFIGKCHLHHRSFPQFPSCLVETGFCGSFAR